MPFTTTPLKMNTTNAQMRQLFNNGELLMYQ